MTASAQHTFRTIMARADAYADDGARGYTNDDYADAVYASLDVAPDDRIGPPPRRRLVKRLVLAVAICAGAAGWVHFDGATNWPRWWAEASAIASPMLDRVAQASAAATKVSAGAPTGEKQADAAAETTASSKNALGANASDSEPATQLAAATLPTIASPEPASEPARETASEPAAPALPVKIVAAAPAIKDVEATARPSRAASAPDARQTRAAAAGLNPELSTVLLARLSDTDFRNAEMAIRKAMAETADDAVFYWPQTVKRGVAQFQIHFVPGAEVNCRRYVVTVAKDGWATTALPMDKCGIKSRAAAASAQ